MFPVGHVLDATYRIERLLGKGGMAYVYAVSHVRLPRRFALKVITAPIAQGSEYVLRFRREAEILAELEHPNLVTVNDWNTTPDGKPYLVMELLSGEDLAQCLHRTGALPTKVALSIFTQVAEALQVAHARNIVHRDLKPANIFLCKNGVVPYFAKVLDFGIAKSSQHAGGAVTENLVLMGTPAYMAPEQAQGNVALIDARTDQFALAIVLYEMLSGRSAFFRRGEAPMLTLYRVISEEPEPLDDERMNRVIMRALRKDAAERYPSLAEFVEAVLDCSPEPIELPERTEPSKAVIEEPPALTPRPPSVPSIPKAVLSNITQPGAEMLPHKAPRRTLRQGLMIGSSVLLVCSLVLFHSLPRGKPAEERAAAAELGPELAADAGLSANPPAAEPPEPRSESQPDPAPASPPTSEALAEIPAVHKSAAKPVKGAEHTAKSSHSQASLHVEPVLIGLSPNLPVGKFILSCVAGMLWTSPRRMNGLVIQLRRTERLKVVSRLPPERSLQLEECLSGLVGQHIPPSVDIRFEAK